MHTHSKKKQKKNENDKNGISPSTKYSTKKNVPKSDMGKRAEIHRKKNIVVMVYFIKEKPGVKVYVCETGKKTSQVVKQMKTRFWTAIETLCAKWNINEKRK